MLNPILKKYPTAFPISFLILVVLVPFWKLTTMQGYIITDDIFTSDIMNDAFPYRFYLSEVLKSGQLPLWYPPIYGGFPLLARAEAGIAFPPNLILFGILPPYVALNLIILLTLITAGVGMYLFVKELEVGTAAALIAAVGFSYSGFMVAHLKHLSTTNAACLFPLGLYFIERAFKQNDAGTFLRKAKPFMWLGLIIGVQNLAGHTQTAYYSGLGYLAYFLFRYRAHAKKIAAPTRKRTEQTLPSAGKGFFRDARTIWFVVAVLIGAGISAVQVLPTYELVSKSQRSGGVTFDYASNYAYDPADITTFAYPYANGDIGDATYRGRGIFWEDYGYVGVITLLLAVYAAVALRKKAHVRFFAAAAVVAYLLVLGPNTPLYEGAFHVVPGMKFFRFPTRFMLIVDAALAVLAAFGVSHLLNRRSKEADVNRMSPLGYVLLGLAVLDLLFFQMRQNPIVDAKAWLTVPETVQTIKADRGLFRIYSPGASEAHKMAFSIAKGWEGSLQPYLDQREFIQPDLNVLFGLSTADGYAQLTPSYVVDLWGDQNRRGWIYETVALQNNTIVTEPPFLKIVSLFNIKYMVSPWRVDSDSLVRMQSPEGTFLYRNPSVMPRAFMVSGYRYAPNPEDAKAVLLSSDFDPGKEAILATRPHYPSSTSRMNSTVTMTDYRVNEVIVRADADRDGLLVLSDTYYPGWRAFVDGKETEIIQANICQRAVEVPSGEHEVRFVFDSTPVKAGFGISVLSLLVACGILSLAHWKR